MDTYLFLFIKYAEKIVNKAKKEKKENEMKITRLIVAIVQIPVKVTTCVGSL